MEKEKEVFIETEENKEEYEEMTVSELKDVFREKDISGYSSMNKEELVNRLEEEILEEEILEEKVDEVKKESKKPKKKIKRGEEYTVLNITPQKLILKDKNGNGVEKPLPEKIDFKIGDKIEL